MKSISLILFVLLFCFSSVFSQSKNRHPDLFLNGKVKYYQKISFSTTKKNGEYVKGNRKKSWEKDENIWFNKDGNYQKIQKVNPDGSVLIEENYIYNDKNKLVEIKYLFNNNEDGIRTFKYNENGLLVEEKRILDDGEVEEKIIYDYNEKGIKTKDEIFQEGELYLLNKYTYKNDTILIEEKQENPQEKSGSFTHYEYNEKNELVKTVSENFKGEKEFEISTEFDYEGNISKVIFIRTGHPTETHEYIRDDNQNLIELKIDRDVFTQVRFVHELDNQGNLIKTFEYKGEEIIFIYEYIIEYYE